MIHVFSRQGRPVPAAVTGIFFALFFVASVQAQLLPQTHTSYWSMRDRLVNHFVVVGDRPGQSVPMGHRNPFDYQYDVNRMGNFRHGSLTWGDATAEMGYYIGMLATEYELLRRAGQPTDRTLKELYFAILTIERLDNNAEYLASGKLQQWDPISTSPNGYFVRDDVEAKFWERYNFKPENLFREEKLPQTYHYAATDPNLPLTKERFIKSGSCEEKGGQIERFSPDNAPSQDQLIYMLMGFSLVRKYNINVDFSPGPGYASINILGKVQEITSTIMDHVVEVKKYSSKTILGIEYEFYANWNWVNPVTGNVPLWDDQPANVWMFVQAYPIGSTANYITNSTRYSVPFKIGYSYENIFGNTVEEYNEIGWEDRGDSYTDLEYLEYRRCIQAYYPENRYWILDGLDDDKFFQRAIKEAMSSPFYYDYVTLPHQMLAYPLIIQNRIFDKDLRQIWKDEVLTREYESGDWVNMQMMMALAAISPFEFGSRYMQQHTSMNSNRELFGLLFDIMHENQISTNDYSPDQMLHAGFYTNTFYNAKRRWEEVLNSFPCKGPEYFKTEPTTGRAQRCTENWNIANRWLGNISCADGLDFSGYYNGIDFMLFYNLYRLRFEPRGNYQPALSCYCEETDMVLNDVSGSSPITLNRKFNSETYTNFRLEQKEFSRGNKVRGGGNIFVKTDLVQCGGIFRTQGNARIFVGYQSVPGNMYVQNTGTLEVGGSSAIQVQANSTLYADSLGTIEIRENGAINLDATARLVVKSGGKLIVNTGSRITAQDLSQIIIEPGGELYIKPGAQINLNGANSVFELAGVMFLENNVDFSLGGTGYMLVSNGRAGQPAFYNVVGGNQSRFKLEATSKYRKLYLTANSYLRPTDNLELLTMNNISVEMETDAFISVGCKADIRTVDFEKPQNSSQKYVYKGLIIYGQPHFSDATKGQLILNCSFKNAKHGIRAVQTAGTRSARLWLNKFSDCENAVFVDGLGIDLWANEFTNCYWPVTSSNLSGNAKVERNIVSGGQGSLDIGGFKSTVVVAGGNRFIRSGGLSARNTESTLLCNYFIFGDFGLNMSEDYNLNLNSTRTRQILNSQGGTTTLFGGSNAFVENGENLSFYGLGIYDANEGKNYFNKSGYSNSLNLNIQQRTSQNSDWTWGGNAWGPSNVLPYVPWMGSGPMTNCLAFNAYHAPGQSHFFVNSTPPIDFFLGQEVPVAGVSACPLGDWDLQAPPITLNPSNPGGTRLMATEGLPRILNEFPLERPTQVVWGGLKNGMRLDLAAKDVINSSFTGFTSTGSTIDPLGLKRLCEFVYHAADDAIWKDATELHRVMMIHLSEYQNQNHYRYNQPEAVEVYQLSLLAVNRLIEVNQEIHPQEEIRRNNQYHLETSKAQIHNLFYDHVEAASVYHAVLPYCSPTQQKLVLAQLCQTETRKLLADSLINKEYMADTLLVCHSFIAEYNQLLYGERQYQMVQPGEPIGWTNQVETYPTVEINAMPNPCDLHLNADFISHLPGQVTLILVNKFGLPVYQTALGDLPAGFNTHIIPTENLPSDIYYLQVIHNGIIYSAPIMVNHIHSGN